MKCMKAALWMVIVFFLSQNQRGLSEETCETGTDGTCGKELSQDEKIKYNKQQNSCEYTSFSIPSAEDKVNTGTIQCLAQLKSYTSPLCQDANHIP